jgi:predicted  nucleic acid-binding Zn-ribbon protein
MASPAPGPPSGGTISTADILAAIQDLGDRMEQRFEKAEAEQNEQRHVIIALKEGVAELKEQRRDIVALKEGVAELKGRMAGIEGQLRQIPTLYQIAALVFAIFGAAFVLIRFASGH